MRPQWFLDNLLHVICDRKHREEHKEVLIVERGLRRVLLDDLYVWKQRGVASHRLLEFLWGNRNIAYLTELKKMPLA